jgi:cell division septum initiation protein DivIVA
MNQDNIERLRNPAFTIARRGYDMREVDQFMLRMADWLESDAVDEIGTYAVQRKLELVGKTTTHILQTTEEESERLRQDSEAAAASLREKAKEAAAAVRAKADEYAEETRTKANSYAEATHKKADEYATRTRAAADEQGRGLVEAATAKANQLVAKGEQRREAIETVIADLQARRDQVLDELDRLGGAVSGTVNEHRTALNPNGAAGRTPTSPAPQPGR